MDAKEARREFEAGRMAGEQLLGVIEVKDRTIRQLEGKVQRLEARLEQYEPRVKADAAANGQPESSNYSLNAEQKRRRKKKKKKKSPGRRKSALKFEQSTVKKEVFPKDARQEDCRLVRKRAVWHLYERKAILVGYSIYRAPGGKEPRIPGVTPRCEYGLEILLVLAFLVYVIGISQDKACELLNFFCELPLRKSQADALLRQLARHWEPEFETICDLLVHAAVVYTDETGWKVGKERCSLWTFASDLVRVFLFGCRKDAATLDTILPPDLFQGIGVSDNAAVYRGRFRVAQKCWAHLLRKAIKLSLLYPRKKRYRHFLDRLLDLYRDAQRVADDQRLGDAGRRKQVAELEGRLCELCHPYWHAPHTGTPPHERDFLNLVNELLELVMAEELFTFVLHPEVESTNNLPERIQRGPAQDRKVGRTNKTAAGARRRTVIVSVLESLRANLETFTLSSVLAEIWRWMDNGVSLFAERWQALPVAGPDTG